MRAPRIAATHQAEAIVDIQGGYPVVMNDPGFDAFARETAAELLGERAAILLPSPIMGAEDFAYVLQKAPGAMMLLGVRPPGETDPAPCHSSRMMLDEDAMALGSALHANGTPHDDAATEDGKTIERLTSTTNTRSWSHRIAFTTSSWRARKADAGGRTCSKS